MVGALLIAGCGGGATAEPATQEEAKTEVAPATDGTAESSEKVDAPARSADEPAQATDAKSESSADVLNVVLQRVIEDEELDKFLHLQSPGRFPLKIAGKELPSGVSLTKAGQPVAVVEAPSSKKDAVLVFTQIEVSANDATIGYRYDVEGIRGTARVKKTDHGWELSSSRIVEH
jgi:hypothetical protein